MQAGRQTAEPGQIRQNTKNGTGAMAEMAIRVRNFTPAKRNSGIGAIVPAAKKKL